MKTSRTSSNVRLALVFAMIAAVHTTAIPIAAQEPAARRLLPGTTGTALMAPTSAAMASPVRWEAPEQQARDAQSGDPATSTPRPVRKKNKALVYGGLAMIGGGVALMVWGPTETSQAAYTTSYNTKMVGGVFAGMGGIALGLGLRGK